MIECLYGWARLRCLLWLDQGCVSVMVGPGLCVILAESGLGVFMVGSGLGVFTAGP